MHLYQTKDTSQTLAEGLAEYYANYPELKRGEGLSPEAREFFHRHDVIHVLYGCGVTLTEEAVVKLASIFGTTEGLRVLRGYQLQEAQDIYSGLTLPEVVGAMARSFVVAPTTIWRSWRQKKRWPWEADAQYMRRPLAELRQEFGIDVRAAHAALSPGARAVSGRRAAVSASIP